ncbi:hypothetical protein [Anaerocolumna chitinilytica]|uniref:Uncharacterized protein n=1 Tax=Anaerocolumna chitinilytica TaxID=1727145 RepID=A0A7I8DMY4_9FIRM|nr:hypothetical protein [Anaerocolumna chitinilytica]BCJ98385.1 hypothetical protein bsdcttw_14260 [Anaerocolumna chitinilytica]
MGIIFTDKFENVEIDCEFFEVVCSCYGGELPSYYLIGTAYGGNTAVIEILINETDVSTIKKLCDKAERYAEQAETLRDKKLEQYDPTLKAIKFLEPDH